MCTYYIFSSLDRVYLNSESFPLSGPLNSLVESVISQEYPRVLKPLAFVFLVQSLFLLT